MTDWLPSLKHYPHFDKLMASKAIEALVRDPDAVAKNSFYPFLRFEEKWQPYRDKAVGKKAKKVRQLRFASRRDAYIYSYYRYLLLDPYEKELHQRDLSDSVIAYRKITDDRGRGKSNINFAHDAFAAIARFGDAAVVTLDISAFFESIDHRLLYQKWCRLIGAEKLPPDHLAVFKAITKYAVVDRDAVYERLGYLTWQAKGSGRIPKHTHAFNQMPKQLCSNADFREKVCGKGGAYGSLVSVNADTFGIPQGSPVSDILANMYLIDFDSAVKEYVVRLGGRYLRYSDDIILIVPGDDAAAFAARDFAMAEIAKHGANLIIKPEKTSVLRFSRSSKGQDFSKIDGSVGNNGLEYLGFRYDGKFVYLRDTTLSRLYRKIAKSTKAEAAALVRRYPGKDRSFIESKFNAASFMQRFGRVEDFDPAASFNTWTFWTYARRAIQVFGPLGAPITRQLANYREIIRSRMSREIARLVP